MDESKIEANLRRETLIWSVRRSYLIFELFMAYINHNFNLKVVYTFSANNPICEFQRFFRTGTMSRQDFLWFFPGMTIHIIVRRPQSVLLLDSCLFKWRVVIHWWDIAEINACVPMPKVCLWKQIKTRFQRDTGLFLSCNGCPPSHDCTNRLNGEHYKAWRAWREKKT